MASSWNFWRPLPPLLCLNFPLALTVDIPKTLERNDTINALEGMIQAYDVHFASVSGEKIAIEEEIENLRQMLPKQYNRFGNDLLISLLKAFNFKLDVLEGDVYGF